MCVSGVAAVGYSSNNLRVKAIAALSNPAMRTRVQLRAVHCTMWFLSSSDGLLPAKLERWSLEDN